MIFTIPKSHFAEQIRKLCITRSRTENDETGLLKVIRSWIQTNYPGISPKNFQFSRQYQSRREPPHNLRFETLPIATNETIYYTIHAPSNGHLYRLVELTIGIAKTDPETVVGTVKMLHGKDNPENTKKKIRLTEDLYQRLSSYRSS